MNSMQFNLARMIGLLTGVYNLGMAMGPIFTGWTHDQTGSYQVGFLVCFLLGAIATGLTLWLALAPQHIVQNAEARE